MITSYATRNRGIHFAFSGTMVARICKSLIIMVDQAKTTVLRQPQNKVTSLDLTAVNEEILSFPPASPE